MASSNLVRAWKDEDYRLSLSEAELAALPANPAGSLELTDADLDLVDGGFCLVSGINIKLPTINIGVCNAFAFLANNAAAVAISLAIQGGGSNEIGVSVGQSA
jgi:mersacidin/lichenicidin family type 2 lantibiotic